MSSSPLDHYESLKEAVKQTEGHDSDDVSDALRSVCAASFSFLQGCRPVQLTSQVPDKSYFSFKDRNNKHSRAVNPALFVEDFTLVDDFLNAVKTESFEALSPEDTTKACYTAAMSFCATVDLKKSGDKKSPGTFFEYLVGHLFSKRLGVNPRKQLKVLNLDMDAKLPTDFIFDLGQNRPKFHVPVKTSTRERVIQVWAHQRVLDGVYGTGRFSGVFVCMNETKTDKRKSEVTEICLPKQWRVYQLFVAQLKRIYYLDVPEKYAELNEVFPKIVVLPFGEFFREADELAE